MRNLICIISFLLTAAVCVTAQQKEPITTVNYLGQKPPGIVPEIFAPGVISRSEYFEHSAAIFTPDGKEVYWSAKSNDQRYYKIYFMKLTDGIWSQPKITGFCTENGYYQQFTLSHDGQKLYFTDGSRWLYVVKQDGTWSSPMSILPSIASEWDINICSVTKSGSIYFIKRPEFDVYVSRVVNGNYKPPEKLCIEINSDDTRENSVFAAPDESYIIIEATKDKALCELFICFRLDDNSWSKRVKLPIKWGRFPSVSPDGKYLFFMTREGIFWVSAKIIEELIRL